MKQLLGNKKQIIKEAKFNMITGQDIIIKYHDKICLIEKIKIGDWIDLRSAETVEMEPFEHKYISLGVSMILPEGYEAHIVPRSSTFKNFSILQTNSPGIVDNSYSGTNDI